MGGGRRSHLHYENIISLENLLEAWKEFLRGKRKKRGVQEFQLNLMDNILELHRELKSFKYNHGGYKAFRINDPKPRKIHKASVRDRLLHRAIYRTLYPLFDKTFIADSFSCRNEKGTHKALNRFRSFGYKISENHKRTCWVLKCDIKKFFENINHDILFDILKKYIPDRNIIWLLEKVVQSFSSKSNTGLPLGNLTSQLLVNIYMSKFDQFIKHKLKAGCYIRYADDFVILSEDKSWLENQIITIKEFLWKKLKLELHPSKIFIKTLVSGVDFLGWVHFSDHRVLRTTTKRRMFKRLEESPRSETLNSYLGLLKHGNTSGLKSNILNRD